VGEPAVGLRGRFEVLQNLVVAFVSRKRSGDAACAATNTEKRKQWASAKAAGEAFAKIVKF
jgi:hypothetical protein